MVLALFIFLFCFCGALFTPTNGSAELKDTKDGSTENQPVIFNSSPVVHSSTSLPPSPTITQSSRISTVSFNTDTTVSTVSPSSSSTSDLTLSTISNINSDTSSATSSSLNTSTDGSGSTIICHGYYVCKENEVCGRKSIIECFCKENYHRINDTCQPKLSTLPTTSLPQSSSLADFSSSTILKIVEDNATSTTSSDSLPPYTGRVVSCEFYNCKENEICDKFSRRCKCKENYIQVNGICRPKSHETSTALYNVSTESSLKAVTNVTSMGVSNSTFHWSSISLKPNFTTTTAPNGENFTSNTATSNNLDTTSTAVTANSKTFTKLMSSTEVTISTSTDTPSYINVTGTTTIYFDTTVSTGIMSTYINTDSSTTELSGENKTLSTTIPSSGSTTSSTIIPSGEDMTSSATTSILGSSASSTTTSVHESTTSSTIRPDHRTTAFRTSERIASASTEPDRENTDSSTSIPGGTSTASSIVKTSVHESTASSTSASIHGRTASFTTTSVRWSAASSITRPSSRSTAFTTAVHESIGSSAIRPGGMSTPLTSITSNSKVTTPTVMDHVDINSTTLTSKKHENTSTTTTNKSTFLTTYTVSKSTSTSDTSKYIEKSTAVTSNFKDSTSTSAQPRSKATLNVHTLIPMSISSDTTVDQRFPTTSDPLQSSSAASMTKRETPIASSAIPEQEVVSSTSVSSKSKNTILKPTTLEQEISTFATSTISTLINETTTLHYTLENVTFYTTPGNITTTLLSQSSDDSVTITSTSPSVDNSSSVELRGHETGTDYRGAIAYGVGFSCGVVALAVPIAFMVIRIKRIQEHRHQLLSSTDNVSA